MVQVGESTHGLRVGVRESALVVLPQDFQIAVNTQPICEKSETLGVYVVKDLEDARLASLYTSWLSSTLKCRLQ